MGEKFKNKYKIGSNRLQNWDYASSASYFVTVCTQDREHFFGEIKEGEMFLSEIGKIAKQEWLKTFEMRPDMNLKMDEFVVMPNHFHAIITIGENQYNSISNNENNNQKPKNQFGPQSKNLASIVRGFKIGVTKNARLINPNFGWQSRYYEHIIKNNESFHRITNYIQNNPKKWEEDRFNERTNHE